MMQRETQDVIVRLLGNIGSRKEVEQYLRHYASVDAPKFAVVKASGAVIEKDLDALDIELPRLTRRFNREYKDLGALDPANLGNPKLPLKPFTPEETREIVFKTMLDGEEHHVIALEGAGIGDGRSVIAFFARQLLKELQKP